jgi:hypothetical protein
MIDRQNYYMINRVSKPRKRTKLIKKINKLFLTFLMQLSFCTDAIDVLFFFELKKKTKEKILIHVIK